MALATMSSDGILYAIGRGWVTSVLYLVEGEAGIRAHSLISAMTMENANRTGWHGRPKTVLRWFRCGFQRSSSANCRAPRGPGPRFSAL